MSSRKSGHKYRVLSYASEWYAWLQNQISMTDNLTTRVASRWPRSKQTVAHLQTLPGQRITQPWLFDTVPNWGHVAGTWLRHGGCMSHWRYCRLRQTVFPETVCNWYGDTPHVTTVSFTVSIHPSHTDTHCVTLNTQGTRGSHRSPSSPMVYPTSSPKETCMPINSPSISA